MVVGENYLNVNVCKNTLGHSRRIYSKLLA